MPILPIAAVIAAAPARTTRPACSGSDLEIVRVVPHRLLDADHATYELKVTVANRGAAQKGNVLQSIVMKQDDIPVDRKGVPPLAAGATYTYRERFIRAVDAEPNSTDLIFAPRRDAPPLGPGECLGPKYALSV